MGSIANDGSISFNFTHHFNQEMHITELGKRVLSSWGGHLSSNNPLVNGTDENPPTLLYRGYLRTRALGIGWRNLNRFGGTGRYDASLVKPPYYGGGYSNRSNEQVWNSVRHFDFDSFEDDPLKLSLHSDESSTLFKSTNSQSIAIEFLKNELLAIHGKLHRELWNSMLGDFSGEADYKYLYPEIQALFTEVLGLNSSFIEVNKKLNISKELMEHFRIYMAHYISSGYSGCFDINQTPLELAELLRTSHSSDLEKLINVSGTDKNTSILPSARSIQNLAKKYIDGDEYISFHYGQSNLFHRITKAIPSGVDWEEAYRMSYSRSCGYQNPKDLYSALDSIERLSNVQ